MSNKKVDINCLTILLLIIVMLTGCWRDERVINPAYKSPLNTPIDRETKPIVIRPIVLELPEGHKLGKIEMGPVCIPQTDLITLGGKAQANEEHLTFAVKKELSNANYNVVDRNPEFPSPSKYNEELILAGTITDLRANVCFPSSGTRSFKIGKGEAYTKIHWKLFTKNNNEPIYESITEGSDKLEKSKPFGPAKVIIGSVIIATQNLMADKDFNNVVLASDHF